MATQLPQDFIARTTALLGDAEAEKLFQALGEEQPVSIRFNPRKPMKSPTPTVETVPWCAEGCYLSERPQFTLDPAFHAGAYYVQEAASMFVAQAYRRIAELDGAPHRVLDLCAAPGGKSTLWRSLLPDGALLVANEPMRQRANILVENLTKWGQPDVCVTNGYPADFGRLAGFFDVVATDVPCSGEGMFRKDAGAVSEWSVANVEMCAERAFGIVEDVWPALREGGFLVFSTCTFNREENEDNVRRICRELGAEVVEIPTDAVWNIASDTTFGKQTTKLDEEPMTRDKETLSSESERPLPVYHFLPHRTRGEGFFLALLRKTVSCPNASRRTVKTKLPPASGAKSVASWLANDRDFKIFRPDATHLSAIRETLADDAVLLSSTVRTLSAGLLLAEEKGRKLIPAAPLALAIPDVRRPDAFATASLSLDEARAYLRREALTLAPDVPRGYVLATYDGLPLGWLNNLGVRANNLYPAEWRIRHL